MYSGNKPLSNFILYCNGGKKWVYLVGIFVDDAPVGDGETVVNASAVDATFLKIFIIFFGFAESGKLRASSSLLCI